MSILQMIAAAIALVIVVLIVAAWRKPNPIETTQKGADEALKHVGEWSRWMSGIQAATIAGLVLLLMKDDTARVHQLPAHALFFALAAFGFLGVAMFFNAWVISSLPSLAIRIHADPPSDRKSVYYDIYELPVYAWLKSARLGYFLAAKHWLWAGGLLAVGLFFISLMSCEARCG